MLYVLILQDWKGGCVKSVMSLSREEGNKNKNQDVKVLKKSTI